MRILHLCSTSAGAPWLVEIAAEQRARGHDVLAVVADEGPLTAALRQRGVPWRTCRHDVLTGRRADLAARRLVALIRLFRDWRPDVVQSHLLPSLIAGRIAGWLADVPIRLSMNPGPYYLESPIFSDLDILTAWADTRVIASCAYTRRLYIERGVPAEQLDLVYYGSNPDRFDPEHADPGRIRRELGLDSDVPLVGMVAYFYAPPSPGPSVAPRFANRGIKGHDVLLRAVPLVLAREPRARFVLVGDGWGEEGRAHRREMEALAASLDVTDRVTFLGERRDVPDLLAAFDVALQCSRSENLGGAIEGLMMAAPMIVSNVGGLVDAVRDGETGLVVPADDPAALAAAILRLLGDPQLARRLGHRGRQLMLDQFTITRTVDDLDALYRTCAAAPRFAGRPPRSSGYRPLRTAARLLKAPAWAWRLVLVLLPLLAPRLRRSHLDPA